MKTLVEKNDALAEEEEMMIYIRNTISQNLHSGIVKVEFEKVDGTMRTMYATLQAKYLPEQVDLEEAIEKRNKSTETIAVWDVEKEGWRSFRWDRVRTFATGVTLIKDEVVYT